MPRESDLYAVGRPDEFAFGIREDRLRALWRRVDVYRSRPSFGRHTSRQVYTPRWAHTDDNHAWVEAWVNGKWYFLGAW